MPIRPLSIHVLDLLLDGIAIPQDVGRQAIQRAPFADAIPTLPDHLAQMFPSIGSIRPYDCMTGFFARRVRASLHGEGLAW